MTTKLQCLTCSQLGIAPSEVTCPECGSVELRPYEERSMKRHIEAVSAFGLLGWFFTILFRGGEAHFAESIALVVCLLILAGVARD